MSNGQNQQQQNQGQRRVEPAPTGRIADLVRGMKPSTLKFRSLVQVGSGAIDNLNMANDRQYRVEVDEERRCVWIERDQGGVISVAYTPFENVAAVNYGVIAKPQAAA